jgi:Xaa-Pro aminopeptidase
MSIGCPSFPRLFHRLMCEGDHAFLNSNEHKRAVIEVESREARFVAETMRRYPLHDYRRLAPLLHQLARRQVGCGGWTSSAAPAT